jgi:hypothetical protein
MGILGFGKKNDGQPLKEPAASPSTPPVDKVIQMRGQGLSNNQIIQTLQNQGFDPNLVFDALNQADIKGGVESQPVMQNDLSSNDLQNPMQVPSDNPPGFPPMDNSAPTGMPPMDSSTPAGLPPMDNSAPTGMPPMSAPTSMPPMDNSAPSGMPPLDANANSLSMPSSAPSAMPPMGGVSTQLDPGSLERIEEIAEAIIDEKWNEIVKSINKIIEWKERTDSTITRLEQQIIDMKQDNDNLTKGVLGKIGEYDSNLVNIGSEIKAMEKVFQKVLPTLTENVHALDKITKKIKK